MLSVLVVDIAIIEIFPVCLPAIFANSARFHVAFGWVAFGGFVPLLQVFAAGFRAMSNEVGLHVTSYFLRSGCPQLLPIFCELSILLERNKL